MKGKIFRLGGVFLYYAIAKRLPSRVTPFLGPISSFIRNFCCDLFFEKMGKNSGVEKNAYLGIHNKVWLGKNSGIGENFHLQGADLKIGDNVMMAPNVAVLGQGHVFNTIEIPMIKQGVTCKGVLEIGDDVWIGRNVTILPGCKHIGNGVVIGACSVVTKSIPDYEVWAGNPARLIRKRKE